MRRNTATHAKPIKSGVYIASIMESAVIVPLRVLAKFYSDYSLLAVLLVDDELD